MAVRKRVQTPVDFSENEDLAIESNVMNTPRTSVPNPDPTWRTMMLVKEGIAGLRAELEITIKGIREHFAAMEKAVTLQHDDYVRVPTQVDKAVDALRELLSEMIDTRAAILNGRIDRFVGETSEKFAGVNGQFIERDTRTDQRAGDTKLAVDAAFAAAKEATAKIEAGFTKQIDGMTAIIDTKTSNLDGRISDIKDRITALESIKAGSSATLGTGLAVTVAAVAVIGLLITAGLHFTSSNSPDNAAALRDLLAQNAASIARLNAAKP